MKYSAWPGKTILKKSFISTWLVVLFNLLNYFKNMRQAAAGHGTMEIVTDRMECMCKKWTYMYSTKEIKIRWHYCNFRMDADKHLRERSLFTRGGGGWVKIWKFPFFFGSPPKYLNHFSCPPPPPKWQNVSHMLEISPPHWLHVNIVIKILEYGYTCIFFQKIIDT